MCVCECVSEWIKRKMTSSSTFQHTASQVLFRVCVCVCVGETERVNYWIAKRKRRG